jgi:hypothetical protein
VTGIPVTVRIALAALELCYLEDFYCQCSLCRQHTQTEASLNLMLDKNHDYGEIWRQMLVSTFTDMLLMRVHRIHQILTNNGKTTISEGIESNLMDMINYSVFALIHIHEKTNSHS